MGKVLHIKSSFYMAKVNNMDAMSNLVSDWLNIKTLSPLKMQVQIVCYIVKIMYVNFTNIGSSINLVSVNDMVIIDNQVSDSGSEKHLVYKITIAYNMYI